MHPSQHLLDELARLSEALEGTGDDLPTIMAVLLEDLLAAVPSFTGLTIRLHLAGEPVLLSTVGPDGAAASSMLLPLHLLGHPFPVSGLPAPAVELTFYAAEPGAFRELAADTRAVYGLDGDVKLDAHLPPPTAGDTNTDTAVLGPDRSTIDQAIGVLITHGHTVHEAQQELADRAAAAGVPVTQIAADILTDTARSAGPGQRGPARQQPPTIADETT